MAQKTLFLLILIAATTMIGYSQETASEYVSPSEAAPRGKAPKMQVQLLNPGEAAKQYAVIFYQGDEAFSGLLEFAEKYQVTSAHFTAIGALNGATLGWFDPQRKMYKKIAVVGQHEVIGMSGDSSLSRKARSAYAHDSGKPGRNHACRTCPRCVRVPDAGSDGDSRSDNHAETV
jgi:predicted DNA-binding protein with PD1-like motif